MDDTDNMDMTESAIVNRLREIIETEARSCSMDFGCITPQYVHRLLGGTVSMEDIVNGFKELQKQGIPVCTGIGHDMEKK